MFSPLFTTLLLYIAAFGNPAPAFSGGGSDPALHDGTFLIQNVRVWQAGEIVGPMDLLIRDGWIEAMVPASQNLSAPGEVIEIEAEEDWVIYPGLIHANWNSDVLAQPESSYDEEFTDPKTGPITGMEYGARRPLRGWMHVADFLDWDADAADKWRGMGFTAGHVVPKQGLLRGRAALVSLNGLPLGEALLLRDGHQVFGLRSRGGYPGTPMGALAVLRQVLLDSARLSAGQMRHGSDPDLADLGPAIFVANGRRQVENVLDLLRDFAPELPAVILGGDEAWMFADRLKQQNVAVLYQAGFGKAMKSEEDLKVKAAEERPYWQEPIGIREATRLRHAESVAGFQLLRATGVKCALVPPAKAGDWKDAVTQLQEGGMSATDLWQAASGDVAEVLGLQGLGRVKAGQGADFVIVTGDPGPEADVAWVFADGRGWEFEEEEEDEEAEGSDDKGGKDAAEGGSNADGTWKIDIQTPMGDQTFYIIVDKANKSIGVTDDPKSSEIDEGKDVGFKGDRIKFTYFVEDMDMEFTMFGKVEGDSIKGKLATDFGDVPATGTRVVDEEQEPAKEKGDESADEKDEEGADGGEGDKKEDENHGVALGHPEWLIESKETRQPANPFSGNVLVRGGTIYALDGRDPFVGDVLILNGVIQKVAESIKGSDVPEGTPSYDATGLHVSPAMMDAHSHLALASINEGSVSITAEVRIADMLRTGDQGIYRAAAGGTALAQSLHGSANPIGGQAAVWELDYYQDRISDLIYKPAKQGIKFALGENVKQSNYGAGGQRFPNTRMGVQATYRRAFTAAKDYAHRRQLNKDGELPGFRRDVRLEVLADIVDNVIHIQCHSYRADELLMFIGVCEEFGIKAPTFQHVLEGFKVAPELAAYGAMGSTFADWWAYKIEAYDAIPWNPGLMHEAGMVASINSDSDDLIRRLNTEAGKSVRYGEHSWDVALSFATLNVAKQLRIDDRLGTLEVGKDGTLAVYDAPPLSTYARCRLTLARGRTLFEWKSNNDENWESYRQAVAAFAKQTRERNEKLIAEGEEEGEATDEALPTSGNGSLAEWTKLGQGHSYLITNARIHSMVDDAYKGWLLIEDGVIRKMGKNDFRGQLGVGVKEIDARGMSLYPGFINGTDITGIAEISSVRGTMDTREAGQDQPDLSVASAIHADSAHHRVTRLNGITHVLVRPDGGRIRGQAALIQLEGDTTPELIVQADLGLVIAFPRASAPKLGQLGRAFELAEHDCFTAGIVPVVMPEPELGLHSRDGVEMPDSVDELDAWFDDALEYGEAMQGLADSGGQSLERDLNLEALLPYARGEKPVLVEADDAITIMAARAWAQDRGLQIIYLGAKEGWKVAGYLGADQAKVILGSVHDLPPRIRDPYDSIYRSASVLKAAGCEVTLRTANLEVTRNLPFQAATAATWGLGRDGALHALTLGAAEILGVDEFTGSIEVGKAANFFLCSGDPLDFTGQIRRMWIGGREVELTSRQTELRDRFSARIEKMKD